MREKKQSIVIDGISIGPTIINYTMSVIQSGAQKVMSFAEVVQGREASVRVTHDGFLYAVDLVKAITGK